MNQRQPVFDPLLSKTNVSVLSVQQRKVGLEERRLSAHLLLSTQHRKVA